MSTEEPQRDTPPTADTDAPMQESPTIPVPTAPGGRRPRLNLNALGLGGGGERKRGKSMFGVLVNTLNKAKAEDKERNASDAAKKRQLIEQRLQNKLRKETDHVRQIEEAEKDRVIANRKEEELLLKDSVYKYRRTHLPILSNFLLTSDVIPLPDAEVDSDFDVSSLLPPRSHPPSLYYLPATLTAEQEAFLSKRKALAKEAAEKEWDQFKLDRTSTIEEITNMRRKAAAIQSTQPKPDERENGDATLTPAEGRGDRSENGGPKDTEMDVDDSAKENGSRESQAETDRGEDKEKEGESRPEGDDEDTVEY